jgi:hypothetical protein
MQLVEKKDFNNVSIKDITSSTIYFKRYHVILKGSMGKRFPYYLPFYSLNRLEWEYRGRGE